MSPTEECIFHLDETDVPAQLVGFRKIESIYELLRLRLPTQRGIVVTQWTERSAAQALAFIESRGWANVLVRSDRRPELPNAPAGGHLVPTERVSDTARELIDAGRCILLLEPADKYDNLYGGNVLLTRDADVAVVELVGPGFDVTDLDRGFVSPHEVLTLDVRQGIVRPIVLDRTLVTQEGYQTSVGIRLDRIATDLGLLTRAGEDRRTSARRHLRQSGRARLLAAEAYQPVSAAITRALVAYIRSLPRVLFEQSVDKEVAVSFSVLPWEELGRFIFWDLTRPRTKYYR